MEIGCSSAGIVDKVRSNQGIGDLWNAGFREILLDLNAYCDVEKMLDMLDILDILATSELSTATDRKKKFEAEAQLMKKYAEQVAENCKKKGIMPTVAVIPSFSSAFLLENKLFRLLLQIGKDSIRYCEEIGCPYIIVRPLSFEGISEKQAWDVNRLYYLELAKACQKKETTLLLQNTCKNINGHLVRGICSDAVMTVEWIDELNQLSGRMELDESNQLSEQMELDESNQLSEEMELDELNQGSQVKQAKKERFGFCMDIGACNLCGQNMQEMVVTLGERLQVVLLRDNDGHHEYSMLPFTSISGGAPSTDWLSLIRGLREIHFDGKIMLNMSDTARAFSPLLRPTLLTLAKSVADFVKWQIEIENALKKYKSIVLFGAGNMCRNFMKCYGENYVPLFTCDNNASLWGSEFCGLEVKSPEALRELPEDCGVFICNIYYREIEQQLREMGVKNIEFFNDEYMPSFHFDRIERKE